MKKFLSLLLSIIMLCSITAGVDLSAYAGGWMDSVKDIEFNTTYTESMSTDDYCTGYREGYYIDSFKFYVPVDGSVVFNFRTECKDYVWKYTGVQENRPTILELFSSSDLNNPIVSQTINKYFNSATGEYYDSIELYLTKGTYYVTMNYKAWVYYYNGGAYFGSYDFDLNYYPTISNPSSLKVSKHDTKSLKLSWNKVANVSGYQLQQYKDDKWSTIKDTKSNDYTVKSLKSGRSYKFRVRAYITVNGTKYYSGWKELSAVTKPSTVSLSSVKASKGKKITVKWKKTSCTDYEVQYATDKNFKKNRKTITVKKSSTTSKTIKGLKAKKKYYVRVRAYKMENGKEVYSAWSKAKSVTTKK